MRDLEPFELLRYARRYQNGTIQTQMFEENLREYCDEQELGNCSDVPFDELVDTILDYQPKLPSLVHINHSPVEFKRYMFHQHVDVKPGGLWASLGNEWYDFWYGTRDNLKRAYIYQVELYPNVYTRVKRRREGKEPRKIFICETLEDVEYVSQEYKPDDDTINIMKAEFMTEKAYTDKDNMDSPPLDPDYLFSSSTYIDWKKFSERYVGIEVRNYNDAFRNHVWYSAFDVDSVCIWDTRAVKSFTEVAAV